VIGGVAVKGNRPVELSVNFSFDIINLVKKLKENAILPTYGSEFAAGADLYALPDEEIVIAPGEPKLIHTGLAMEIP
jgi:dUTPase